MTIKSLIWGQCTLIRGGCKLPSGLWCRACLFRKAVVGCWCIYFARRSLVCFFKRRSFVFFKKDSRWCIHIVRRSFVFLKKNSHWCIHFVGRSSVCLLSKTVVLLVSSFHKTVCTLVCHKHFDLRSKFGKFVFINYIERCNRQKGKQAGV